MALLEVKDLHTYFHTRDGVVRAVDAVSLEVDAGETLGLVGESGCGKSVTALSIMRLIETPPGETKGEILFDGRNIQAMGKNEVRKIRGSDLAMIFQDPMTSLNPVLRVGRQISEGLRLHLKLDRQEARQRTLELLKLVGIPDAETRVDDYPHQFSGGMRQRLVIAIALACKPRLVLADEPTTALDVTTQAQILDLLRDLARELNTAFILITHDLGLVAGMTQRVIVMYAGRIVEAAATEQIFENPKMPYSWGLLRSVPRLDVARSDRLVPIEGRPPDPTSPPNGCRFEPRCPYRRDICREREPDLVTVPDSPSDHTARCWGTQDVPGGGWLIETDWKHDFGDQDIMDEIQREWGRLAAGNVAGDAHASRRDRVSDAALLQDGDGG